MRHRFVLSTLLGIASAVFAGGCDLGQFTVNTTAKVLVRAQPAVQQEADWQLAHDAIPGTLKTIEGFWVVDPSNEMLIGLLTEGYCQYGTAFVEDDWEVASFAKDSEAVAYHNQRSTHIFSRCLNFALDSLGDRWKRDIFQDPDTVKKLLAETSSDSRNQVMWAALALGSLVNHNLNRVEMIGLLPTVTAMLEKVLDWDSHSLPGNKVYAALPHIALGMVYSAVGKELGGKPDLAAMQFQLALKITDNKMLLARALYGYRVGKQTNDEKLFHDQLVQVLDTPPSIWPEQRLANEVAHRRARRYLTHEKEWFNR